MVQLSEYAKDDLRAQIPHTRQIQTALSRLVKLARSAGRRTWATLIIMGYNKAKHRRSP